MEGFSSFEVTLGRYFFYGTISLLILCHKLLQGGCRYPLAIWTKSFIYSIFASIGYYTFVVLSMRYCSPAMCALILGTSPITISFYGNWKQQECHFKALIIPSILILLGLVIINMPHLRMSISPWEYSIGIFCGFISLMAWSWYAVANSLFLKSHPHVASSDWCTLIGVSTLIWVMICAGIFFFIFADEELELDKFSTLTPLLRNYLIGSSLLGFICSWLGAFLWNKASFHLPVSLAGQLTIFETIFGVVFVYAIAQELPPQTDCLGIAFLLSGIVYGIRISLRHSMKHAIT